MLKTAQYKLHLCIRPCLGNKVWSIGVTIMTEPIILPLVHVHGVKILSQRYFQEEILYKYVKFCMLSVHVATDNLSFTRGMGEGVVSMITTPYPIGCILGII